MPSLRALAVRQGEIGAVLAALATRVNARLATPIPPPARIAHDPQIARLEQLEYLAALLTALLDAEEGTPPDESGPPAAGEPEPPAPPAPAAARSAAPAAQTGKARAGRR